MKWNNKASDFLHEVFMELRREHTRLSAPVQEAETEKRLFSILTDIRSLLVSSRWLVVVVIVVCVALHRSITERNRRLRSSSPHRPVPPAACWASGGDLVQAIGAGTGAASHE